MKFDIKDYVPFYSKPALGMGFESITFNNRANTLLMHGRWTFLSNTRTYIEKKTRIQREKTTTDDNILTFVHAWGRCFVEFNGTDYSWWTEPSTVKPIESERGTCKSQESAEKASMKAIRCGWLHEPTKALIPLTRAPQSLKSAF